MLIIVMLILICMLLSSFVSLLVARLVTWVFPIITFRCCSAEGDNDVAVVHVVIIVCYSPRSRLCHLGLAMWMITVDFVVAAVDLAHHAC